METKPEKATDIAIGTSERIVLAAEVEFSERGFEGAGMKAISRRAEVSQALLHYHFGNKDHLYDAVISRRSQLINTEREALLDQVDTSAEDAVDRILEALFRPPLGPAGGNRAYNRIFGGLIVGHERERALVRKYYDPTALRFISALRAAIPRLDQQTAALCYTLALGALVVVISRDGRVERLMGLSERQQTDDLLKRLIKFARGGIEVLAQE